MSVLSNEVTTARQAKNGTRAFLCERTGCTYLSYVSGYVRRLRPATKCTRVGIYQLNAKTEEETSFEVFGRVIISNRVKRIMMHDEAARLELIEKRAKSYCKQCLDFFYIIISSRRIYNGKDYRGSVLQFDYVL